MCHGNEIKGKLDQRKSLIFMAKGGGGAEGGGVIPVVENITAFSLFKIKEEMSPPKRG